VLDHVLPDSVVEVQVEADDHARDQHDRSAADDGPTEQVIQGTLVVLVACIVVGLYLWGADQVFQRLVQRVLLR